MKSRINRVATGRIILTAVVFVLFFLVTAEAASDSPPPPVRRGEAAFIPGVPGGIAVNTLDVSAEITAIEQEERRVTLLGADGKDFTVKLGPEAVNFDQLKVGDMVNATVTQELVIYLQEEGAGEVDAAAEMVALAPKGAPPGGLVVEAKRVTGTVLEINEENRTVKMQFENGNSKTLPVRPDIDLSKRKVGEKFVFKVTEMIAVRIEKP